MDAVDSVPLNHGLDQLGRAPGPAQHPIGVGVMAVMGAFQHGFGLFFPDTAVAEWKGEFLTTTVIPLGQSLSRIDLVKPTAPPFFPHTSLFSQDVQYGSNLGESRGVRCTFGHSVGPSEVHVAFAPQENWWTTSLHLLCTRCLLNCCHVSKLTVECFWCTLLDDLDYPHP